MSPTSEETPAPPAPPAEGAGGARRDLAWFAAIVLVAWVLRLVFTLQFAEYPLAQTPHMDEEIHHEWALANLRGEIFWDGAYFRAPLYVWFVTAVYWLFGADPLTARLAQTVLGALACGMTFWIGRRAFGRTIGVIAGFASATYWTLIYFDAQLMIPVLISLLDLVLLWLLLWTHDRPRPGRWALCGLLLGLSAIARPNVLLFAPFLVAWQVLLLKPQWKRFLGHAACLTLGTLAPILPITARNWLVGGDLSLIATQGGVNWYIGNNPGSDGMTAILPGDPPDWWRCFDAQVERAESALGRELRGSEVSQFYARKTVEFWREHTDLALALTLRKLGFFWTRYEIANSQDIYLATELYAPVVDWLPVGFWIVGPLGVLGLVLVLRRKRLFPLWGFVLVYMCSVVAFFVTARYRIPAVHVLVPLAVYAGAWCLDAARRRRFLALAGAAAVVAAMAWVGSHSPGTPEYVRVQGLRSLGLRALIDGDWAEAERFFVEATSSSQEEGFPDRARIWFSLGLARQRQGKLEEARAAYDRAWVIRSKFRELAWRRGQVRRLLGDVDGAEEMFERAVERDAEHLAPRLELADLLLQRGRAARALDVTRAAVEAFPGDPSALWMDARVQLALGDPAEARARAEQALPRARAAGRTELVRELERLLSATRR